MDLEKLQEEASKDLKIDDTDLDMESVRTPIIHNKYLKYLSKFSLLLKRAEDDYDVLAKDKWEYYTGKADESVYREKPFDIKVLKQDVDKYIKSDVDLIKLSQKIVYLRTVINYLEGVIRNINNRTFNIKNAIEWKKFTQGSI
jgi:hypothetical protein